VQAAVAAADAGVVPERPLVFRDPKQSRALLTEIKSGGVVDA
jgi:pyrroloquinoline quinone biosynthesis protein E